MNDPYSDWKAWKATEFAHFSATDAAYYGWHVRRALPGRTTPLQVLEVGFGNGRFMGWLNSAGHHVLGVEANPMLVSRARAAGFEAETCLQDTPDERRYDLIAAFDVLEHVDAAALQEFVRSLAARLAPQGRLLLRFPNGESPFGLWMQHGDITHVHPLGLSKLRQLCVANGLRVEHSGEALPWQQLPRKRRGGARVARAARRVFEWMLRKMYALPKGLDLSPNQLVVLGLDSASLNVRRSD